MSTSSAPKTSRISGRTIGGLVIAAVLVVWILANREQVEVSFLVTAAVIPLWVVLGIASALGVIAGFLIGRSRYRSR